MATSWKLLAILMNNEAGEGDCEDCPCLSQIYARARAERKAVNSGSQ